MAKTSSLPLSISTLFCLTANGFLISCNRDQDGASEVERIDITLRASTDPIELNLVSEEGFKEEEWTKVAILDQEKVRKKDENPPLTTKVKSALEDPTLAELRACAVEFGVSRNRLVVVGSDRPLLSSSVVVAKANQNTRNLKISLLGYANQEVAGICVLSSADQSLIELNIGLFVESLYYQSTGTNSNAIVHVFDKSSLFNLKVSLEGTSSVLTLAGLGTYPCETVDLIGWNTQFFCEQ